VVLKDCPVKPLSVTLMRTGDSIDYIYSSATLSFAIPDSLKSVNVTDVVKVEFGEEFDPEPYLFKHW